VNNPTLQASDGKNSQSNGPKTLLRVEDLHTYFFTGDGTVKAVRGVDFEIREGETLCIVGESGSGKSVTAQSILRLVQPPGRIVQGQIWFGDEDIVSASNARMREVRGNKISMIFQEPMTALNPVIRIGEQIAEVVRLHRGLRGSSAKVYAIEMLSKVGIPDAASRIHDYPYQLSGGMRQRVMIAMALCCNPRIIIADEPTTALDVTIQAQILELMKELQARFGLALLLITHDLGIVAETAQHVAVMYAGQVVEYASVHELFERPLHPYTIGLMRSVPGLDTPIRPDRQLPAIPGLVPSLINLPAACAFQDRCPHVHGRCREEEPALLPAGNAHQVRCWLHAT
jgi:oligopeptide/dipeptide ABC transporter ATP-binding protein